MVRQIFQHGLFHADPHPGNVLFLHGNRVAFLDFGMFGRLAPADRRRMALVFWSLVDGDYDDVAERMLRISGHAATADADGFRNAVAETVEAWYGQSAHDYSLARLLLDVLAQGAAHRIAFPRALMLLARALVNGGRAAHPRRPRREA
jgi:ubiquinone biosynthesis protein